MVFARTSKAAARLSEQVRNKEFKKKYLVISDGKFQEEKGTLQNYLLKNERLNTSKVVKEGTKNSKLALLDYEVLKYNEEIDLSLVKINLHTGRHHQIRLQFSNIGHPIYGDQRYGNKNKKKIHLFAYKLEFNHPTTKELLTFKLLPEWKELNNETIIHRL